MRRTDATFINGYYYHIFNRGVAKLPTFDNPTDFQHLLLNCQYHRFQQTPLKLSKFRKLPITKQQQIIDELNLTTQYKVAIQSWVFMPNHVHFLMRQETDDGVKNFVSRVFNSYTKYFNTKHERVGPLFQGRFKAVMVENENQLIHLSRYIHINPLVGKVVRNFNELIRYPWSSLPSYIQGKSDWINLSPVIAQFKNPADYEQFLKDHIDYAKQLNRLKHLTIDHGYN